MSCFDTCFFERYALLTLQHFFKDGYDDLVNRDRPDLQTPDGKTFGIEVTRAVDETEEAEDGLLDNLSGYVNPEIETSDLLKLQTSGYGYGLKVGKNVGIKETLYWSMALPLKRILDLKVAKLIDGFYGDFDRMDLFVFCHTEPNVKEIRAAVKRVMEQQKYSERYYSFLYLSYVDTLFVCNLDPDIKNDYRVSVHHISQDLRSSLFISALE